MTKRMKLALAWIALFISSTGFSGFLPGKIHPRLEGRGGGLIGSLVAVIPLYFLWEGGTWMMAAAILGLIIIVGTPAVRLGEELMYKKWGARCRHTGESVSHDYNETNLDEVAGMFVATLVVWPLHGWVASWVALLIVFVFFRASDTVKLWPIGWVEDVYKYSYPELSVMLDDLVAGLMAGIVAGGFICLLG